jgi:hypothetical protein
MLTNPYVPSYLYCEEEACPDDYQIQWAHIELPQHVTEREAREIEEATRYMLDRGLVHIPIVKTREQIAKDLANNERKRLKKLERKKKNKR